MPYTFTAAKNHRYRTGDLFLGIDPTTGHEIGLSTERHVITIAGSGSGKGAGLLIPNLRRWPHNALNIDPKGENAEHSWQEREAMGQRVGVLDPFHSANVPDRLRVSCNLLAGIRPDSRTAREDIRVIADGLVMRYKAEDGTWDNGSVTVLAGMIAYVCGDPNPEGRNLPAVRQLLTLPPDDLRSVFEDMAKNAGVDAFGSLMKAAAAVGLSDSRKNREFVGGAIDHTEWLDSPAMASILTANDFELSELKTGEATLFLVLPPEYLDEHARFLRTFVRAALDAMAKGHDAQSRETRCKETRKCLFLLDEFFSLGRIDQIAKAAGLMRSYGVQLWPILQDLGQLAPYGHEGAQTFFANSDAHIFFANTDAPTLEYISKRIGNVRANEVASAFITPDGSHLDNLRAAIGHPPQPMQPLSPQTPGAGILDFMAGIGHGIAQAAYADRTSAYENAARQHGEATANARSVYEHKMRAVGTPRLDPAEVCELVAKKDGDAVARSMIVFAKGGDVFNLKLAPYFSHPVALPDDVSPYIEPEMSPEERAKRREIRRKREAAYWHPKNEPDFADDLEEWGPKGIDWGGMAREFTLESLFYHKWMLAGLWIACAAVLALATNLDGWALLRFSFYGMAAGYCGLVLWGKREDRLYKLQQARNAYEYRMEDWNDRQTRKLRRRARAANPGKAVGAGTQYSETVTLADGSKAVRLTRGHMGPPSRFI